MSYTVKIDDFTEEYWRANAAEFADYSIYQTWPYQDHRAENSGCSIARVIVTDENDQVCAMCQVRIKNVKSLGLKVGYVQAGPLVRDYDDQVRANVSILVELRKALLGNYVNVLRFVPNLANDSIGSRFGDMLEAAGFRSVSDAAPYRTLVVDISKGEEDFRKGLNKKFRYTLKNVENSEVEVRHSNDESGFEILDRLYSDLKKQKGFVGLDTEEFSRPQQELADDEKMDLVCVYNKDKPISTALVSNLGDTGIVLLAAANEEGRKLGGPYLNWYSSAKHSMEAGKRQLDLGGIDPENNLGVYRFKSKLGGKEIYNIGAFDACSSSIINKMWKVSHKIHSVTHPKKV